MSSSQRASTKHRGSAFATRFGTTSQSVRNPSTSARQRASAGGFLSGFGYNRHRHSSGGVPSSSGGTLLTGAQALAAGLFPDRIHREEEDKKSNIDKIPQQTIINMTNRGPSSSASGSTTASTGVLMVGPNFKVGLYNISYMKSINLSFIGR